MVAFYFVRQVSRGHDTLEEGRECVLELGGGGIVASPMNNDAGVVLGQWRESAPRVEVGESLGLGASKAVVLQDSNNVVVWLSQYDVVAKVGIWPHSAEVLNREVEVCAHLAAVGAPVAAPIGGVRRIGAAAWPVSLWRRLRPAAGAEVNDHGLAEMLGRVHEALGSCAVELPSYMAAIDHARVTLFDDEPMRALSDGRCRHAPPMSGRAGHATGRQLVRRRMASRTWETSC